MFLNKKRKIIVKKRKDKFRVGEKNLNANTIAKLSQIFNEKSWEIEDDALNQLSLFNRFCTLLSELTEPQQALIIELTERFTRIPSDQYKIHIRKILDQLATDPNIDLSCIDDIYIAPLIAPEDIGKTKSSVFVQYSFQEQFHYNPYFAHKNIRFVNGLDVESSHINNDKSLLFVVDDFIGTGDTACSALNYLFQNKNITNTRVIVISIVALNQGITKILDLGVRVFTSLICSKGISEYYSGTQLSAKLTLMESIENKIKVHRNEKLGYGQSEALVKMIRTPNNTFPVFWKEKKGRTAPFPR